MTFKRTFQTSALITILCLLASTCFTLTSSSNDVTEVTDVTVNEVTFLGYVVSSSSNDAKNLSAIIQVEGTFGSVSRSWRASLYNDDCGGTLNDDFFVVQEMKKNNGNVDKEELNNVVKDNDDKDTEGGEVNDDDDDDESKDESESITMQVVLPEDRTTWEGRSSTPLFLCVESKTLQFGGEVIKWSPLGSGSSFALSSPPTSEYILNEESSAAAIEKKGRTRVLFMYVPFPRLETVFN
jgi:hypothetical protein